MNHRHNLLVLACAALLSGCLPGMNSSDSTAPSAPEAPKDIKVNSSTREVPPAESVPMVVLLEAPALPASAASDAEPASASEPQAATAGPGASATAQSQDAVNELDSQVAVNVLRRTLVPATPGRSEAQMHLLFQVQNKSARELQGLLGQLVVFDSAGQKLGALRVQFNDRVPAGKAVQSGGTQHWTLSDPTSDEMRIAALSDSELRVRFEPLNAKFAPAPGQ